MWAKISNKKAKANYKPYVTVSLLRRDHWNSPWESKVERQICWKPVT